MSSAGDGDEPRSTASESGPSMVPGTKNVLCVQLAPPSVESAAPTPEPESWATA